MRKILFSLAGLFLIIGVGLSHPVKAESYFRIAVLPFEDGSVTGRNFGQTKLGDGVADELVTALLNTGRFRLIERERIQEILREQDLGIDRVVDPRTAAKVGQILGAQYVVLGRITEFTAKDDRNILGNPNVRNWMGMMISTTNARVALDARLVNTTTAEILASVSGTGLKKNVNLGVITKQGTMVFGSKDFKDSDLGQAFERAVRSVAVQLANKAYDGQTIEATSLEGMVAHVGKDQVYINLGKRDGVEVGMSFLVSRLVEQVKDPESGGIIDEVVEPIAEITVVSVKQKSAVCQVSKKLQAKLEIEVTDQVKSAAPVKLVALPPLKEAPDLPVGKPVTFEIYGDRLFYGKSNNFTLYQTDDNSTAISFYGGKISWGNFKLSGEKSFASEIDAEPSGRIDVAEIKVGYSLNRDQDVQVELYGSNLFVDWNSGEVNNHSLMFGADIENVIQDNITFEGSFGYGIAPETKINGSREKGVTTNITTFKVKFKYNFHDNLGVYLGYRSYEISRRKDQSFAGPTLGAVVRF